MFSAQALRPWLAWPVLCCERVRRCVLVKLPVGAHQSLGAHRMSLWQRLKAQACCLGQRSIVAHTVLLVLA